VPQSVSGYRSAEAGQRVDAPQGRGDGLDRVEVRVAGGEAQVQPLAVAD